MKGERSSYCAACFDGDYAVPVDGGNGPQPIQLNLFGSETKEV